MLRPRLAPRCTWLDYIIPAYDDYDLLLVRYLSVCSRAIFCKQLIYVYVKINPANAQRRAKGQVANNVKRSTQTLD